MEKWGFQQVLNLESVENPVGAPENQIQIDEVVKH